jgi:hypothetical protein
MCISIAMLAVLLFATCMFLPPQQVQAVLSNRRARSIRRQ